MPLFGKALEFRLERWIQRGALHQLLFVAAVIAAISCTGGLVAWFATGAFDTVFDAIWWSFLRMTDPGYLGDDEGATLRAISTVVTVLGYVTFMGSLIAIMTQWLAGTLRRLESGLTPITMHDHVVVLGWTNRTPEIVARLLGARGRLTRFLQERGVRKLRVVVQSDVVDAARRLELREHLGALWHEQRIVLRSGSPLELNDLARLDLTRAAAILVPGADFELGGADLTDARVVKTLLTLRRLLDPVPLERRPVVVAEIFDPLKVATAENALPGELEVVSSDATISQLVAQTVRHHKIAAIFFELLSHEEGCSLYVRGFPQLAGESPLDANGLFARAVVVGAVRRESGRHVAHLVPPADFRLERDDLLVFVARQFADCLPSGHETTRSEARGRGSAARSPWERPRRLLILGWSYKLRAVLAELSSVRGERFEITLVSRMPVAPREQALRRLALDPERVRLEHVEEDYTQVGVFESMEVERFDSVVLLASSEAGSGEEADARTLLGYVLLKAVLAEKEQAPEVLVELLEPANSRLFEETRDVMLVSPNVLSLLQAQVALRPELSSVFTALFVAGGAEVTLRTAADYGLAGRAVAFLDVEREATARGEVALGVSIRSAEGEARFELSPEQTRSFALEPDDEIVVLADTGA